MKYLEQTQKEVTKSRGSIVFEQASLALIFIYNRQRKTKELIELLASDLLSLLSQRNSKLFEAFTKFMNSVQEKVEISLGESLKITKIFSYYSTYHFPFEISFITGVCSHLVEDRESSEIFIKAQLNSEVELESVLVHFNLDQEPETPSVLTSPSEPLRISKGKNTVYLSHSLPAKQKFWINGGFLRVGEHVWMKFEKQNGKKFEVFTKQIDYRPPVQFETRAISPFHGEHEDTFVTGILNHLEVSMSLFSENSHIDEMVFEFPSTSFSWIGPIECRIFKHGSRYDNPDPFQVTSILPGENLTFELHNPVREDYVLRIPVVPTHLFSFPVSLENLVTSQVKCRITYHLSINKKISLSGRTLMVLEKKFLPPVLPSLTVKHLPGYRLFNMKLRNYLFNKEFAVQSIEMAQTMGEDPLKGIIERERKVSLNEELSLFWRRKVGSDERKETTFEKEKITFTFEHEKEDDFETNETERKSKEKDKENGKPNCEFFFSTNSIVSSLVLEVQTKINKFLVKNEVADAFYELELLDQAHKSTSFCFKLSLDPKKIKIIGTTQRKFAFSKENKLVFGIRLLPLVSGLLDLPETKIFRVEGKNETQLDNSKVIFHGKKQVKCYAQGRVNLKCLKNEEFGEIK